MAGGAVQAVAGVGMGVAASWTGVGAIAGVASTMLGADNIAAGASTFTSGRSTPTVANQVLRNTGLSESAANIAEVAINFGTGIVGVRAAAKAVGGVVAGTAQQAWSRTKIVTVNGIEIEGFVGHGINRAIGDTHSRLGVSPNSILDALKNPLKIKQSLVDDFGRSSQRFIGGEAEVVLNPLTGRIVSANPTSSKKLSRLLKNLGDGK